MEVLENEKANILKLQNEIQSNYNLITKKIDHSNKKDEKLKKEVIESHTENKFLMQNIKTFTKDNKELQKKLYQKEKDKFKLKICNNKTSNNIEILTQRLDEQDKEMQQYKEEIKNLKNEIKKQSDTKDTSIPSDFDIKKDFKLYRDEIQSITDRINNNLNDHKISSNVIERMLLYFETLNKSNHGNFKNSQELEVLTGITSSTIRKDLSALKIEGMRGQGYNIKNISENLEKFLFSKPNQNTSLDKTLDIVTTNIKKIDEEKANTVKLSNEDIEELNKKILAIESHEWYIMEEWAKENNAFECNFQKKAGYFHFFDTLSEFKKFHNKLTTGQMIKAREIYTILENAGYDFISSEERRKDEGVDDFLLQFVDEIKSKK